MVGLPARGKTYIAHKIMNYLGYYFQFTFYFVSFGMKVINRLLGGWDIKPNCSTWVPIVELRLIFKPIFLFLF